MRNSASSWCCWSSWRQLSASVPDRGRPRRLDRQTEKFVGAATPLEVVVDAPGGRRTSLHIDVEQGGTHTPLIRWDGAGGLESLAPDTRAIVEGDKVSRHARRRQTKRRFIEVGPGEDPGVGGAARCSYGIRRVSANASKDVAGPARTAARVGRSRRITTSTWAAPRSIVYRVAPADVASGVRVGDLEYPGYPASGRRARAFRSPTRGSRRVLRVAATTRTSTRRCASSPATRPATARRPTSITARFRSRRSRAASSSTTSFSSASCRRFSRGRPKSKPTDRRSRSSWSSTANCAARTPRRSRRSRPKTVARDAVARRRLSPVHEHRGRSRRSPIGAPYVYQGQEVDHQVHLGFDLASFAEHADRRGQSRQGGLRRRARHLRQLRDHRPRHGRAVALRAPVVDRRRRPATMVEKDQAIGKQRHDRAGRRRPPALHDARQRPDGESGRVVGRTLDRGSDPPQAARGCFAIGSGFSGFRGSVVV